jgi:microcystin-dependent protein
LTTDVTGTLPVANGGTGVTSKTGTGNAVLSSSPSLSTPSIYNPTITNASAANLTSLLGVIYPIGCIYTETTGVNPGTTFGFGTWAAYGAGEVLVGYKSGDANFGTAGGTGGEATHTLTSSEMPSHGHAIGWNNGGGYLPANATDPNSVNVLSSNNNAFSDRVPNGYYNGAFNQNTGGGGAHNNIQPYIVVFFWERTA